MKVKKVDDYQSWFIEEGNEALLIDPWFDLSLVDGKGWFLQRKKEKKSHLTEDEISQVKNIIITGAAQGMGAAVSEYCCAQGAKVCVTDVNLDGCKEVVERIKENGGEAIACQVDVRKREDHVAAIQATVDAFGSLNVSLNNAGVNKPMWFMEATEENYDFIFDINVRGAWTCSFNFI